MRSNVNILWVGPEPLRRHLIAKSDRARCIDASGTDAIDEINTRGMFTNSTHLIGLSDCDEKRCKEISEAVSNSGEPTTGEADKLGKSQERALQQAFTITKLSARGSIREIAGRLDIRLDSESERTLAERLGHDPGRLVGVLEALAAGGYTQPNGKQVALLAGSSQEEGMPWHLLDTLEKGKDPDELLDTLEAIPTIAFLAKRAMLTLYAAENPDHGIEEATDALGDTSEGAWNGARRMAGRLGAENARLLVAKLLEADTWAKRGRPREALMLASGHTRKLLTGR